MKKLSKRTQDEFEEEKWFSIFDKLQDDRDMQEADIEIMPKNFNNEQDFTRPVWISSEG